jgi:hypothetical protein
MLLIGGGMTFNLHLRGTEYRPDFSGAIFYGRIPESVADIN